MEFDGLSLMPEPFRPTFLRRMQTLRENCEQFLACTPLLDNFGNNHDERRRQRARIARERGVPYNELWGHNKLGVNNLSGVWSTFESIVYYLDELNVYTEHAGLLRKMFSHLPTLNDYNDLSQEERLNVTERYDETAREFLKLFDSL